LCELYAINVANNVKLNGNFICVAGMKNVRLEADKILQISQMLFAVMLE
jgi:hypothetical protein